jgi:hypothetical protein
MRSGFLASCLALLLLQSAFGQGAVPPVITSHPGSVTVHPDDLVILRVGAEGVLPISYQWKRDGSPLPGETNSALFIVATLPSPPAFYTYQVDVSNAGGTVTSLPALVYVTKRPQTITFAPPQTVVAAGSGVVLNATATSGLPVTFTLVSGPATLSGSVLTGSNGPVVVRATQPGNSMWAPADLVERTIQFISGALSPFITTPLANLSPFAGTRVTLQVSVVGSPTPALQWQKDGLDLPGATASSFVLESAKLADSGRYSVTATNLAGSATAATQVTVRSAPVIVAPPASQTVAAGATVTLAVDVAAFPAATYQWRRNGAVLPGATGATLVLNDVRNTHAGDYVVDVTNSLGSATSGAATLTVITRDFSGTYLGRFAGDGGDFALMVRGDGTAAFFGHLPAQQAGLAGLAVTIDLAGQVTGTLPLIATTSRPITLRATVDEVAGTVTGSLAELTTTFEGVRAGPGAAPAPQAGLYTAALVGSGAGRGYVIVAPDGQGFVITAAGTSVDSARGTLGGNGRLTVTTATQATVDVGFTDGALRGTVRTATGTTGIIAGAIEALVGTERLVNLAVRGATTPAQPMITGFAIGGTTAKQVLIRAAGPGIARAPFSVAGALADPTLQLFRVTTTIGQNNNWGQPAANAAAVRTATTQVGAFPFANGSDDAALLTTLQPGVYSAQITGGNGIVLAEIYEVPAANEAPGSRRLVNLSTRAVVTPDAPLIAGFVISGTAPQRVLIRAVGPTLGAAPFNLPGALANPRLSLQRGTAVVAANDDWFQNPEAALISAAASQVRAFALGAQRLDAALLVYLEPGAYTAVVTGPPNVAAAAATGIALVEVYESAP